MQSYQIRNLFFFNKLKLGRENETDFILRLSTTMMDNSNDETNFSHKLLLTNMQVANLLMHLQIIYILISNYQKFKYLK